MKFHIGRFSGKPQYQANEQEKIQGADTAKQRCNTEDELLQAYAPRPKKRRSVYGSGGTSATDP